MKINSVMTGCLAWSERRARSNTTAIYRSRGELLRRHHDGIAESYERGKESAWEYSNAPAEARLGDLEEDTVSDILVTHISAGKYSTRVILIKHIYIGNVSMTTRDRELDGRILNAD